MFSFNLTSADFPFFEVGVSALISERVLLEKYQKFDRQLIKSVRNVGPSKNSYRIIHRQICRRRRRLAWLNTQIKQILGWLL
jgi:hypothetical protein